MARHVHGGVACGHGQAQRRTSRWQLKREVLGRPNQPAGWPDADPHQASGDLASPVSAGRAPTPAPTVTLHECHPHPRTHTWPACRGAATSPSASEGVHAAARHGEGRGRDRLPGAPRRPARTGPWPSTAACKEGVSGRSAGVRRTAPPDLSFEVLARVYCKVVLQDLHEDITLAHIPPWTPRRLPRRGNPPTCEGVAKAAGDVASGGWRSALCPGRVLHDELHNLQCDSCG